MASANVPVGDLFKITFSQVVNLLKFYSTNTYLTSVHNAKHDEILQLVEQLWIRDYNCLTIQNADGRLCYSYPARIFVPETQLETKLCSNNFTLCEKVTYDSELDVCAPKVDRTAMFKPKYEVMNETFPGNEADLKECVALAIMEQYTKVEGLSPLASNFLNPESNQLSRNLYESVCLEVKMKASVVSRCRNRIVVPVILYKEVYVARSATVSVAGEVYTRNPIENLTTYLNSPILDDEEKIHKDVVEKGRIADIALLKHLKIDNVFDLMVEEEKICFRFLPCSTSEKKVKEEFKPYSDLFINQLPYPGCEFFKKFKEAGSAEKLHFNWDKCVGVKSELLLASEHLQKLKDPDYKSWPLFYLTQKYLLMMLTHLKRGRYENGGLLVHCISGWDRTPLFVSLLRISLWADGVIHKSMNPMQMLYFTLAYDWMFFGHDLSLRNRREELILFFCFYFLKFIKGEEFNTESIFFGLLKEHDLLKDEMESYEMIELADVETNDSSFDKENERPDGLMFEMSPVNNEKRDPKTKKRESPDFKVFDNGAKNVKEEDAQSREEMAVLQGARGMSSPTLPGEHMRRFLIKEDERKKEIRYQRITELRRLFYMANDIVFPETKKTESWWGLWGAWL